MRGCIGGCQRRRSRAAPTRPCAALLLRAGIKGLSRDDTSWLWPGRAKGPSKDLTWVLSVAMPHRRQRSLLEKAQGMAQRDQGRWAQRARAREPPRRVLILGIWVLKSNYRAPRSKPWTTKDDRALRAAVAARGPKWVAIGAELGRPPDSCKYRHREIAGGDAMRKGAWDADEDARLQQAVEKARGSVAVVFVGGCAGRPAVDGIFESRCCFAVPASPEPL